MSQTFKALGDVNRLKSVQMLAEGEKYACKLPDALIDNLNALKM